MSADGWIMTMSIKYTTGFYSIFKENETMKFGSEEMGLEKYVGRGHPGPKRQMTNFPCEL